MHTPRLNAEAAAMRPLNDAARACAEGFPTIDELRTLRVAIDGEIARRAGTGIILVDEGDRVHDAPPGGATMTVSWCTSRGPTVTWYPTEDAAHAALLALADREGRAVAEDRWIVDLTPPGCVESSAWVSSAASDDRRAHGGCTTGADAVRS